MGRRRTPQEIARIRTEIRLWHAKGWTDKAIADKLGETVRVVNKQRLKLKLASHAYGKKHRDAVTRGNRRRFKSLGIRGPGELRWQKELAQTARKGWPPGVTRRGAGVLAALRNGPLTTNALAKKAGLCGTQRGDGRGWQLGGTHWRLVHRFADTGFIIVRQSPLAAWRRKRMQHERGTVEPGRRFDRVNICSLAPAVLAERKIWERGQA
jgi:hypothetical protein